MSISCETIQELNTKASIIRRHIVEMITEAGSVTLGVTVQC